jgi:hypothetical protein
VEDEKRLVEEERLKQEKIRELNSKNPTVMRGIDINVASFKQPGKLSNDEFKKKMAEQV